MYIQVEEKEIERKGKERKTPGSYPTSRDNEEQTGGNKTY